MLGLGSRQERRAVDLAVTPVNVASRDQDEVTTTAFRGRLHVYCGNFGDFPSSGPHHAFAKAALEANPGHVTILQEASQEAADVLVQAGWLASDRRYAGQRTAHKDGLLVAAKPSMCLDIVTHTDVSGSIGQEGEVSSLLACTVRLRWVVQGVQDLGLVNMHIHRVTAKRGQQSAVWKTFLDRLEGAMRACNCRVLAGDANMGLFLVAGSLRSRGWEIRLAAHHREVGISTPVDLLSEHGRREALRYDSIGVFWEEQTSKSMYLRLGLGLAAFVGAVGSSPESVSVCQNPPGVRQSLSEFVRIPKHRSGFVRIRHSRSRSSGHGRVWLLCAYVVCT